MTSPNESEKRELTELIEAGKPLPDKWRGRLFPSSARAPEVGKEYRLVYDGKARREEVLAQTPAAPWQLVRQFCTERPYPDGWRNLLVWGDNLLALRELLTDQQGPNRFGTRDKIRLIYIDPPFATRQDFMKDKEKAYRDKVLGAQFIELHTGAFAEEFHATVQRAKTARSSPAVPAAHEELDRLINGAERAHELGLKVNAGHGLNYENLPLLHSVPHLVELNIGHSIISRAVFVGLAAAVKEMLRLVEK